MLAKTSGRVYYYKSRRGIQTMKRLTSSIFSFEKIINEGILYVDKTEFIWNLIQDEGTYFLSRPRRFGKSLTVSTLEAVFQGKKELFKGLAIYDKPYDWKPYPVIHLDFANVNASTADQMESYLNDKLAMQASAFGVALKGTSSSTRFENLIQDLAGQGKVVILVDEYDKPILESFGKHYAQDILELLKAFYSVIKSYDANERFAFITGVSKFSHVSLFSGMNNPTDLTMRSDYATMLGFTQEEFEANYAEYIDVAVRKLGISREAFLEKMKKWYDGYKFSGNAETVYNPVSVTKFFESPDPLFSNYWFSTATPTFLLEYCRNTNFDFKAILTDPVPEIAFDAYELDSIDPLALFLQTGYLTIKDTTIRKDRTYYYLKFPNEEVQWSFEMYLLNVYTGYRTKEISSTVEALIRNLGSGNVKEIERIVKNFFANFPYAIQLNDEKYYQSVFYALFYLIGIDIEAEVYTNDGRIDTTIEEGNWRYIFEFKLNQTSEIALDQIEQKEYFQKYLRSGKRIMIVGANFDFEKRQISDWKSKKIEP